MVRKIEENREDRMSSNEDVSVSESENEAQNGYEADSFVVEDDSESEYEEEEVLKPRNKKSSGIKKKKTKLVDDLEEDLEAIDKAKMTRGLRKIKLTKRE